MQERNSGRRHIEVSAIGTGSTTVISGLPFAANNDASPYSIAVGEWNGIATSCVFVGGSIFNGGSTIDMTAITAANVSSGVVAIFQNGASIRLSAMYRTG